MVLIVWKIIHHKVIALLMTTPTKIQRNQMHHPQIPITKTTLKNLGPIIKNNILICTIIQLNKRTIKKYHKINYQKVDVVRDDTLFKIYFKKHKTKNIK